MKESTFTLVYLGIHSLIPYESGQLVNFRAKKRIEFSWAIGFLPDPLGPSSIKFFGGKFLGEKIREALGIKWDPDQWIRVCLNLYGQQGCLGVLKIPTYIYRLLSGFGMILREGCSFGKEPY